MRPFADMQNFFTIYRLYGAYSRILEKGFYFSGQQHDFWELVIVTDGEVGVTAGPDVFRLKKGQAVLHEPMEFHRIWTEGSAEAGIIILAFSSDTMPPYLGKVFPHVDIHAAKDVLEQIQKNYVISGFVATGIIPNTGIQPQFALKALEVFILQLLSAQAKIPSLSSRPAQNYATIVKVMEDNIHESLLIADIARLCNMGEVNLKQTFSRYAGMGVMQYFNRLKVTRATAMLQKGSTVQEVAAALGFASQNYFSTVFKRITGKSPSAYKAER